MVKGSSILEDMATGFGSKMVTHHMTLSCLAPNFDESDNDDWPENIRLCV
jgi:hypothetical protein